jgi:hypothetical protein
VRVYPSCEVVGSFSVRAHRGLNRVRFRGRFRDGRPLPAGTYRLLVHTRGQARAAAALTIVVARGLNSPAVLRRARRANSCSLAEAREIETAASAAASGHNESSGDPPVVEKLAKAVITQAVGAVKDVTEMTQALSASIDDRFPNPLLQTIIGLLTLLSACLGGLVLTRLRSRTLR